MTLVGIALLAVVSAQDPETIVYRDDILNLAFSHPKEWKMKKRDNRQTLFEIPLTGTEDVATLEIIRSSFRSEPDIWQTIQLRSNELSKNTVIRQWEQTVLDAPILMTQAELNEKGRRVTRLTGLYYTRTPLKLLFNLDVPTAKFEEAQYVLNKTMESLRTIDGTNFSAENPDVPATNEKPTPVAPRQTVDDGKGSASGGVKPKNEIESTVGAIKSIVRFREGWTAQANDKGIVLSSKKLSGDVVVEIANALDTSPQATLRARAGDSLATFAKVARREDRQAEKNEAGALVSTVWRRGEAADGALQTLDAIVVNGDRFLMLHFTGKDVRKFDAEQGAIEELLKRITVEAAS